MLLQFPKLVRTEYHYNEVLNLSDDIVIIDEGDDVDVYLKLYDEYGVYTLKCLKKDSYLYCIGFTLFLYDTDPHVGWCLEDVHRVADCVHRDGGEYLYSQEEYETIIGYKPGYGEPPDEYYTVKKRHLEFREARKEEHDNA